MKISEFLEVFSVVNEFYYEQQRVLLHSKSMISYLNDLEKINHEYYEKIALLKTEISLDILVEVLNSINSIDRILGLKYIKDSYILLEKHIVGDSFIEQLIGLYINANDEESIVLDKTFSKIVIELYEENFIKICEKCLKGQSNFVLDYYNYHQLYKLIQKIDSEYIKSLLMNKGKYATSIALKEAFEEIFDIDTSKYEDKK